MWKLSFKSRRQIVDGLSVAWVVVESGDNTRHTCTRTCFNMQRVCSSSACVCMYASFYMLRMQSCWTVPHWGFCIGGFTCTNAWLYAQPSVHVCMPAHTHTNPHSSVWISSWAPDFLLLWHMISLGSLRYHPRTKGDLNAAECLSSAHATVNQRQLKRALPAKAATMIYE